MTKTILIVEDDELNRKLFTELLRASGYDTVGTGDGRHAVEIARARRPDLVLMDIELPEVSGLDAARMMKADAAIAGIPVIAVTAFAMEGDEERFRDGGCDGYIAKPISVPAFLETIARHLG